MRSQRTPADAGSAGAFVSAVVVAAGSGERLAAGRPKAFVDLAGEPMVVHAVRTFATSTSVNAVVAVVGARHVDAARAALSGAGLEAVPVCAGGDLRQESVARGLDRCPPETTVVAVHDAARPLVSHRLIAVTLGSLNDPWAAVAPGVAVVDTLKLTETATGRVLRTVPRSGLVAVQTPQVFAMGTLRSAHARAGGRSVTDDLALVEAAGGAVRIVPGDVRNLKVTYPADLELAEALLRTSRS